MNVLFFGTPQFSTHILKKLIHADIKPVAVVTAPDKPAGRGHKLTSPPIKTLTDTYGIPILQPQKFDEHFMLQISNYKPDIFVVASYGKILPKLLLEIPPKGTINVHPSLLPMYRGPAPIQATILHGDTITGVTLMLTDEKMDHGPIIANSTYTIARNQTYAELHDTLAKSAGELLVDILPKWVAGAIIPQEQNHKNATYTKLFTKEDGHINWSKTAEEIDRLVRALNPWPGTWSYLKTTEYFGSPTSEISISEVGLPKYRKKGKEKREKRVKILMGHPTMEHSTAPPGTIVKTKNGQLAVCTGDMLYNVRVVQVEGKQLQSTKNINEVFYLLDLILS
jgi:methionyl-tRNA formyltransferase